MTYYKRMEDHEILSVLALDLRQADKDELKASAGDIPVSEALLLSLQASVEAWVVVHDGRIEAVFGVSEGATEYGVPWFLATDKFSEFRISFAKESREVVRGMLDRWGFLLNFVDSRH